MTLGDIIKEYLEDHTVNEFINDSGISKAYTYNLINNKGTSGSAPTPTIDTINKVARGVHSDFDTVFNKLDPDIIVNTKATMKMSSVGKLVYSSDRFTLIENEGGIQILPNPNFEKYAQVLKNPTMLKLIDAAKDCTPQQLTLLIEMINTFKKGE